MSRYLNKKYAELGVYTPGEQPQDMVYTKLNTNESPYPAAPEVVSAIDRQQVENLRLYSDPECKPLVQKLADVYDNEEKYAVRPTVIKNHDAPQEGNNSYALGCCLCIIAIFVLFVMIEIF